MVEVLTVCSLLALMLAMAWPNFGSVVKSARLNNLAYQIAADIRTVQELAQVRWTRSRFVLTSDGYELQVGTEPYPSVGCLQGAPSGYEVVKRVSLADANARLTNATIDCFIFERTGRAIVETPSVVDDTPPLDSTSLTRLFNRIRYAQGTLWDYSSEAARWEGQEWVRLVIDLGRVRQLNWIRPCMVAKGSERVPAPKQVSLYWHDTLLDKDDPGWTLLERKTSPSQCETFDVFAQSGAVRYLLLEFQADRIAPRPYRLAVDEIELEQAGFQVEDQTGRLTRTLTVNPASGVVTVK